jgi:hypothetical protein
VENWKSKFIYNIGERVGIQEENRSPDRWRLDKIEGGIVYLSEYNDGYRGERFRKNLTLQEFEDALCRYNKNVPIFKNREVELED